MTLTEKQQRFVDEYMKDGNATQAAIRAGYSEKTAYQIGHENLRKHDIAQALKARNRALAEQLWEQFARDAVEARKVMFEIMKDTSANQQVRLSAAKDLMDRGGFKPVEKVSADITTTTIEQFLDDIAVIAEDEKQKEEHLPN